MTSEYGTELPPEYDATLYRSLHPDLTDLPDAALYAHFRDWGEREGRIASPATTREGFLQSVVNRQKGDMLEIGPFCRPIIRGSHVSYLDVLDATALRQRAREIGLDPSNCPDQIHYVGELAAVDRRFAAVISSHAIEHQPDLVAHLQAVDNVLEPNGRYFLIIPDKRYSFDALIPESTIANVLLAHHEKRRVHNLQSVIEHRAMVTHNDPSMHWRGEHGPFPPDEQARRVRTAVAEFERAAGNYIDVHAWYWTPVGFRQTMGVLRHLGLTTLAPVRIYGTPRDRFEFCAVLEKITIPPETA